MMTTPMDAESALRVFITGCVTKTKAVRYLALISSRSGQKKFLGVLDHEFMYTLRPETVRFDGFEALAEEPCFVFMRAVPFGQGFGSIATAMDELAIRDGWLLLLHDGSAGILRPELIEGSDLLITVPKAK